MKNLKLFFIPLVMVSLFSLAHAADCPDNGFGYECSAGDYCSVTISGQQCSCDFPGTLYNVSSGETCGNCPYNSDLGLYSCSVGLYCAATSCACDAGANISSGTICGNTPAPASCTYLGQTLHSGQTMQVFQSATVSYTGTCVGLTLTCTDVGGIGIFTPSYVGYNFSSCIVLPPPAGSCILPRGGAIISGDSVTAYQVSSVACGGACASQIRTCNNGILSGTYLIQSCSVASCGGGGGGGGGGSYVPTCIITDLMCSNGLYQHKPGGSCQGGNLGNTCTIQTGTTASGTTLSGSIVGSTYSDELNDAYLWAYVYGITTMNTIQKADMGSYLVRAHMAKMMSNFAITLGGLTPDTGKQCNFSDITTQSAEMKFYIKLSCQLGLMGVGLTKFDPTGEVTRAQFGTVLSRLIRGTTYNGGTPYYTSHLNALKLVGIMTQISTPNMKELRGYVMLMMKRAYEPGFMIH